MEYHSIVFDIFVSLKSLSGNDFQILESTFSQLFIVTKAAGFNCISTWRELWKYSLLMGHLIETCFKSLNYLTLLEIIGKGWNLCNLSEQVKYFHLQVLSCLHAGCVVLYWMKGQQMVSQFEQCIKKRNSLTEGSRWLHAATFVPSSGYCWALLLSWPVDEIYSCSPSSALPPSCFPAITKLFCTQIDMAVQLVLSCWT